MSDDTTTQDHRFPCQTCGSDMRYLPGSDRLHCDHCGAEDVIDGSGPWAKADVAEQDFEAALTASKSGTGPEMEETRVLQCASCGAQVEFEPGTHAAECPFCATPVVTDTGINRHIKPHAVLPILLSEREAREAMNTWLGRLWFAPTGLQEYARKGRRLQGIYMPYWTYDADTTTDYSGQRGTVYHETRQVRVTVNGKVQTQTQSVPKVRWKGVTGRVTRFFDDVLVLASHSLPKAYTDALAPWDLSGLQPYQPEYLAGFRAEAYQVPVETGMAEARQIMNTQIQADIRFDIGGDRQKVTRYKTEVRDVTYKHVLLPVWVAAYKYRGESYRFIVNARTGRVQGERPWSAIKIAVATIIGILIAGAIGYGIAISQ